MINTFRILGTALLIIVALYLMVMVYLPTNYQVQRSINIKASNHDILHQLENLKNWDKNWSPWKATNPEAKVIFSGPESGINAAMEWSENNQKLGKVAIKKSNLDSVCYTIAFHKFKLQSEGTFHMKDMGESTHLTWTLRGNFNFVFRWVGLKMDTWMAPDMEKGLQNIKHYTEAHKSESSNSKQLVTKSVNKIRSAFIMSIQCPKDAIGKEIELAYSKILKEMKTQDLILAGHPFAIYYETKEGIAQFDAGIPINKPALSKDKIRFEVFPAFPCVQIAFTGTYEQTQDAHWEIKKWFLQQRKALPKAAWEVYQNDPKTEKDPSKYKTLVVYKLD